MSDPVSDGDGGGAESYLEIQMDRSTIVLAIAGLVALLVLAFLLGSWTAGRNPDVTEATGAEGDETALATEEASDRAPAIEEVDVDGDPPFGVQPVSAAGAPPLTAVPSPRSGSRGAGVVGDGEPSSGASTTSKSTSTPKPTRVAAPAPPSKTPVRASAAAAPSDSGGWVVQVAALTDRAEADALRKRLEAKGHPVTIREEGGYFKVHVGPFAAKPDADRAASRLGREDRLGTWVKKP